MSLKQQHYSLKKEPLQEVNQVLLTQQCLPKVQELKSSNSSDNKSGGSLHDSGIDLLTPTENSPSSFDPKKESPSDFTKSFYEAGPLDQDHDLNLNEIMRKKGNNKVSPKKQSPRKKRKSVSLFKKSFKNQTQLSGASGSSASLGNDDSVIILSPADSLSDISPASDCGSGGAGHYRSFDKSKDTAQGPLKRRRLFPSSSTAASGTSGNNTIDLIDDDDVIVLSDDDDSHQTLPAGSTKAPIKVETNENEDVEIVAVKVHAPGQGSTATSRRRNSLRRVSVSTNKRNSLSFSSVKLAVERVRKRTSSISTPSHLARPAVQSHGIKKRNKGKKNRGYQQSPNAIHNFQFRAQSKFQNIRRRQIHIPQRRETAPVFVLDQELGPANPNFQQFPSSSQSWNTQGRLFNPNLGIRGYNNPFNLLLPPTQPTVATVPAEPNFISVSGNESHVPGSLRLIVVDGSNVAMSHKGGRRFSCRGIEICVNYFKKRGHEVVVFVPQYRRKQSESENPEILEALEKDGVVKFTPSRDVGNTRISSYDDRFIVQYAHMKDAVIVSNDNYRDIYNEEEEWRNTIRFRILQFTWPDEEIMMFPQDPLGRNGPSLDEFLRF